MAKETIFINDPRIESMMRYPVGHYLAGNLEKIQAMAELIEDNLENYDNMKVVNLICRGSSGAIISAIVLQYLISKDISCKITHIKKEGEVAHSSGFSIHKEEVNIIIDDFISSGATMRCIYDKVKAAYLPIKDEEPPIDMLVVTGIADLGNINFVPKKVIAGTGYK